METQINTAKMKKPFAIKKWGGGGKRGKKNNSLIVATKKKKATGSGSQSYTSQENPILRAIWGT